MKKYLICLLFILSIVISPLSALAAVNMDLKINNHINDYVIFYLVYELPNQPKTTMVYDLDPLQELSTNFTNSQALPSSVSKPAPHYYIFSQKSPPPDVHNCLNNYVYVPNSTMHIEIYEDGLCVIN